MQLEPIKRPTETELEPKRKVGRPRKTPQSDAPPTPMLIDQSQKRKPIETNSPGKDRAKAKKKGKTGTGNN